LGRLGGLQQAQTQAVLDAQREANRLEAFEPYERLGTYGSGLQVYSLAINRSVINQQ